MAELFRGQLQRTCTVEEWRQRGPKCLWVLGYLVDGSVLMGMGNSQGAGEQCLRDDGTDQGGGSWHGDFWGPLLSEAALG